LSTIYGLLLLLQFLRTPTTSSMIPNAILETNPPPGANTALIPTSSFTNGSFQESPDQDLAVTGAFHGRCRSSTERLRSRFSCVDAAMSFDGVKWTKEHLVALNSPIVTSSTLLLLLFRSFIRSFIHSVSYRHCCVHCSRRVQLFLPDLIDSNSLDPVSL